MDDELGFRRLVWSDYERHYEYKHDGALRKRLMFIPRALANPSMHAGIMIRASQATPRWMRQLWRNLLISLHSIDVDYPMTIGPGLLIAHPINIAIGEDLIVGRNVTIYHNVSIGHDLLRRGVPQIGNEVVICPGAVIVGDIKVGDGAVIGANAFVDEDVPAGMVFQPRPPSAFPPPGEHDEGADGGSRPPLSESTRAARLAHVPTHKRD